MVFNRLTSARVIDGAPVPLFDRLIDMDPLTSREAQVWRRLSVDEVRQSVATELARLFDARRPEGLDVAAARPAADLTVLDYGIPDFGLRSPADVGAKRLLAAALRQAILAFEPRLAGPVVELEAVEGQPGKLTARITGHLVIADVVEPVTYRIDLGGTAGKFEDADGG